MLSSSLVGKGEEGSSEGANTSETHGELREGGEKALLARITGRLSGRTQSDQRQEARIPGGRKHFGGAQG